MIARIPLLVLAVVAALPLANARASDADVIPTTGSPVSVAVVDLRDPARRGDDRLGTDAFDEGGGARGPKGFSLEAEVAGALLRAGDDFGIPVFLGQHDSAGQHIDVEVHEYWCDDSTTWSRCSAALTAHVWSAGDRSAPIDLVADTEQGFEELSPQLAEMWLLELARAQSTINLGMAATDPEAAHPSLRFGWVEHADGSRFNGAIGNTPTGICVQGRGGRKNAVSLEEIAAVRVVDVPLPSASPGRRWAVLPFPDGSWVGGTIVRQDRLAERVIVQTSLDTRAIGSEHSGSVISGEWTGAEPSCATGGVIGGVSGGVSAPPRGGSSPPRAREQEPGRTRLVYVDRRGQLLQDLGPEHSTIYALREARLGNRRWGRYRLSWAAFADAVDSPMVSMNLDDWVALNRRRKAGWTGAMYGGIGAAVFSGVLAGVLTAAYGDTFDDGVLAGIPVAVSGIGGGIALAGISGILRVKFGKRADRPHRYHNLLDYLTLDELDAAMEHYETQGEAE